MKKLHLVFLIIASAIANLQIAAASPVPQGAADTVKQKLKTDSITVVTVKANAAGSSNSLNEQVEKADTATSAVPVCLPQTTCRKWLGWIIIVLIITLFVGVAWKSDLLRDQIADPVAFMAAAKLNPRYQNVTDINKIPKPFSLSRAQLGVWTVIISCSYVYLGLAKYFSLSDIAIDSTILALMGISAGTTVAGSVIDNNATPDQQGWQAPSGGFLMDILSDQNGINIHRFQNVIWTFIAMTLYLLKVPQMACGEFPVLDSTLIALTGISSVTYLGLKINENKPPVIPPSVTSPVVAPPVVTPPVPGTQIQQGNPDVQGAQNQPGATENTGTQST